MDNLRGAVLMTVAMFLFALEDMFIKLMAGAMPTWQIVLSLGLGGSAIYAMLILLRGQSLFTRGYLSFPVFMRCLGELIGTTGFVTALAYTPISSASAILQATPLAVTLAAAIFMREPVGWRRWSAIFIGFLGVLLVVRPGMEGFNALSLFAVIGVIGLALRDISTRGVHGQVSTYQLSFLAFLTLIPTSLILGFVTQDMPVVPDKMLWALIVGSIVFAALSYYAIVAAMRIGEVSFVTPFRYSRMLFALLVGFLVFGERPDALMLLGATIIVASGIYTVLRERKLRIRA
ncbi:EamA family transporter [Sulfitobacter sp. BDSS02]|nr:EamA family transporter [Sulfitobacter sp. BDSS02]MBR9850335.1 DMT family transporter [Paracoccaceae bacterium]